MANTTVYPYGTGGSLPSSIGLINDLTTGGVDKALTAEMGKQLGTLTSELDETVNGIPPVPDAWVDLPLSQGEVISYYIDGNANKWYSNNSVKGRIFEITPGQKFRITAGAAVTNYSLLKTNNAANNVTPDYATGTTWSGDIAAGQTSQDVIAPSDAHYLYVLTFNGSATERAVVIKTSLGSPGVKGLVDICADVEEIKAHVTLPIYDFVDAGLDSIAKSIWCIDGITTKWHNNWSNWGSKFLPVTPGNIYKVIAGSGGVTNYAFMTSNVPGALNTVCNTFASGCTLSPDQAAGTTSGELVAPADAQYLYVLVQTGSATLNGVQVVVKDVVDREYIDFEEKFSEINGAIDSIASGSSMKVCEGETARDNVFPDLQTAVNACPDNVLTTISIDGDLHISSTVTIPATKMVRLIGGGLKGSISSPAARRNDVNNVAKIYIGSLKPQWIEVDGVVKYPASSKREYLYKCTFATTSHSTTGGFNVTTRFNIPVADAVKLASSGYSNSWVTILDQWMSNKFRIDSVNTSTGQVTCTYFNGQQSFHATTGSLRMILENVNISSAVINDNSDTWGEGTFYYTGGYLYYKYSSTDIVPNIEIPNIETLIVSNGYLMMDGVKVSMTAHDFDNLMGEGEGHGYRSLQSGFVINGAIDIGGAANITSCTFTHTTNNAIRVLNTAENVTIDNCTFEEVGTDAILVGVTNYIAYNKGQMSDYVPATIPINVNIIGNSVHHPGRVYQEASGIALAYAATFYIGRNVISDTYYTGISTGLDWKAISTQQNRGGIVEYNLLKNIGVGYCAMGDGGAFYNLGEERAMIFRNNIITSVFGGNPDGVNIYSTYFDQGSSNIIVENNVVYDTYATVFYHQCRGDISVNNNIFAFPKKVITAKNDSLSSAATHNIFAWNGDKVNNQTGTTTYVGNLYYRYDGTATASFDESAVIGNPGFRDADNYDFEIADDTYTSQINFVPFSINWPSMELIMRTKNSPEDEAALAEWKTRWNNGTL